MRRCCGDLRDSSLEEDFAFPHHPPGILCGNDNVVWTEIILNLLELDQCEDSEVHQCSQKQDGAHCQGDGSGPDLGVVASPSSPDTLKEGVSRVGVELSRGMPESSSAPMSVSEPHRTHVTGLL